MYPIQLPSSSDSLVSITKPEEHIWVLELHNGADNRFTEHFCETALKPALEVIETQWRDEWRIAYNDSKDQQKVKGSGALIIVADRNQNKFFSNGFHFPSVQKKPHFIKNSFNPIMKHLLEFPIPVIAAINGHAFAAGFTLAMASDYRIMKGSKAWLCMNEVLFGAPLPHSFVGLFNTKVAEPTVKKVFLEAHRFTSKEALDCQLVDEVIEGDSEAIFEAALKRARSLSHLPRFGVYGLMKKSINSVAIQATIDDPRMTYPNEEDELFTRSIKSKL